MPPLDNPYAHLGGGAWLRTNLHTHTDASDGNRPLQSVIDDYAARGYDALMISDHDIFSGPDRFDTADPRGMTLLAGNEVTAGGVHLLHVGADRRVEPDADRQGVIDQINAGPGFAIVNHPNWQRHFNHCPLEAMSAWTGYAGIEVFNGSIFRDPGSAYATDKWDMLLGTGRRVWGFANDDMHAPVDMALGWNMVYAPDRTAESIVEAMRRGRFYASTGVTITSIAVEGTTVRVETEDADRIVAGTRFGTRLATADGRALSFDVTEHEALKQYVRFTCWGTGESMAWTQPLFIGEP